MTCFFVFFFFPQLPNCGYEHQGPMQHSATVKLVNGVHIFQHFGRSVVISWHFGSDSAVAILRLRNSWKGRNSEECFTPHLYNNTFLMHNRCWLDVTVDIWLVPIIKAELHQKGLDQRKEDCCSGILYLPK